MLGEDPAARSDKVKQFTAFAMAGQEVGGVSGTGRVEGGTRNGPNIFPSFIHVRSISIKSCGFVGSYRQQTYSCDEKDAISQSGGRDFVARSVFLIPDQLFLC